jgi:tetratricopeptide (TPR) repeat protein
VTPILIALAATAAAPQPAEAQLKSCLQLVRTSPDRAALAAEEWRVKGGGLDARQCLGLAHSSANRWPAAASTFEIAAREAEVRKDARSSDFWAQSGNAWLAAGDAAKARKALDSALAAGGAAPQLRGEIHLDRARAAVMLNDAVAARADIDKGLELVPQDPFGWYLSAALARRENKLDRAKTEIAKAVSLAPDDAAILLEAGTIAGVTGDADAALGLYARAAQAQPQSEAGRAAQAALAANGAEPAAASPPAGPKS